MSDGMPDRSPRPARVRPAALRHRDRRRIRSRDARGRARPRRDAAGTSRCSRRARAITTPGATSTQPGTTTDGDGVIVHRFPVEGSKPKRSRARIEARIQSGAAVPLADQLAWLDGLFRVPDLFHHLVVNSDRYDAVILSPYLFWTTVTGATIVPERTIVMPCLHDEPYAHLDVLQAGALRRRAPLVPLRARAPARAQMRDAPRPRRHRRGRAHSDELRPRRLLAPATASSARSSCSRAGASAARAGTGCSPRSTSRSASTTCRSTS